MIGRMEIGDTSWQMWVVFAGIGAAIILYASEIVAIEIISISFVGLALVVFHLAPVTAAAGNVIGAKEILAGFADPALVAVLCLLVIGQGMVRTGALEGAVDFATERGGRYPKATIAFVLVAVAILSAFVNNTPVVIVFIPVLSALADKYRRAPAAIMMPLSFAAILGGMTTLIGSSTNLLVAGAYRQAMPEMPAINFFDFVVPGGFLACLGLIYVLFVMPILLKSRVKAEGPVRDGAGRHYIAQLTVHRGTGLDGAKAIAGMFAPLKGITVRMIDRHGHIELPPYDDVALMPGDKVVVAATRGELMALLARQPDLATPEDGVPAVDPVLVEVSVPPASRMVGRNIPQTGFEYQSNCLAMGVQRRSRMVRALLEETRLEAGDVLLVYGAREDVTALRANRDILLLEWSSHDVPAVWRAWRARLIFLCVILLVITNILPIVAAAILGAITMVVTGCLNVHQAARAIDRRVGFLVASALAMGTCLSATGGAQFLADGLISLTADAGAGVTLAAMFALIAVLTNVISNNAAAVLFTPIAISAAQRLGVDPLAFVFGVIFAANCSFATPMGYQTNLLVMGPGHYNFSDFLKAGIPLVIVIWLGFSLFAPWYYGF